MSSGARRGLLIVLCLAFVGLVAVRAGTVQALRAGEESLIHGESGEAERLFRTAHLLDPLGTAGIVGQADAAFQAAEDTRLGTSDRVQEMERTVALYRGALQRRPADPYSWAQLGRAYASLAVARRAGRVIDISQLASDADLRDPEDALAVAALERAVTMEPHNYDYLDFLAEVCLVQGRDDALDWFRRGTFILPRLQNHPHLKRPDLQGGVVAAAVAGAREAVGSGNAVPDHKILAELALFHARRNELEEAVQANREAIEIGHTAPGWLWTRQGIWLESLGRREEAVSALERALQLDPTRASAHFQLARIAADNGDIDGAVVHLEAARNLSPRALRFQMELARTLDGADRLDDAAREYRRAMNLPGGEGPSLAALVDLYRRHEVYDQAIVFARRLVDLNPDDPVFSRQLQELTQRLQF